MVIEQEPPKCPPVITKTFLESLLKKEILFFTASPGTNPGDNYSSVLFSLEVHLVNQKSPLYLLFKTFPEHPTRQKFLENTNIFLKEYQVYNKWIPELIKFQNTLLGIGRPGGNGQEILRPAMPELIAGAAIDYENEQGDLSNLDPVTHNFILMTDVRRTYGFKMADKLTSLTYHHVKVVLDELAKYHALGHAYKVHNKLHNVMSKFPFISDAIFCHSNQKPMLEAMLQGNFTLVTETLKTFFQDNPEIKKGFLRVAKNAAMATNNLLLFLNPEGIDEEKVEGLMRKLPAEFQNSPPLKDQWICAGHGDCWTNNMLFKEDEATGKVSQTILVDLQVGRESCLMADLTYFIYTSTDTKFRKDYLIELLQWYHQQFLHYSKILKVEEPFGGKSFQNFENFKRKFHRSKVFGFYFATWVWPLVLQRAETTKDLNTLEVGGADGQGCQGPDDIASMFNNMGRDEDDKVLLRERFSELLKELYDEGVL